MSYTEETRRAMEWLSEQNRTIFLGQTVVFEGSPMFKSLDGLPNRIELPVTEEMQMGMSIGLALKGYIPVSVYPRIDFLLLAMNQLVNHLNHCEEMSCGEWRPVVIVRTQIGNTKPLYPGKQHCGDYTEALRLMCDNIDVVKLEDEASIVDAYKRAYFSSISTILIETPQGNKGNSSDYKK
jgi:pyruvate/2-oxoglutarate/acetoin dehydrogenase E1 component